MKKTGFAEGAKRGIKRFQKDISYVVNSFLLSFVYLLGVGFTFAAAKIAGKDFFSKKSGSPSYWKKADLPPPDLEEHYRQF